MVDSLKALAPYRPIREATFYDVKAEGGPELERQLPAPAEAIETYRANAVDLVNANVNATLDYARRLADVRSPAEFIAVSAGHAHRLFELMMRHTVAMKPNKSDSDPQRSRSAERCV